MHGRTREKANDPGLSYSFVRSARRAAGAIAFLVAALASLAASRLFSP